MLRTVTLALLLAVGVLAGGCSPGQVGPPLDGTDADPGTTAETAEFPDCYVPAQESEWAAEIIQLVNDQRANYGLDPLAPSAELSAQANVHACDMIHYNFFGHVNPVTGSSPTERLAASGFEGTEVGENIGTGQQSPAQLLATWINSPEHRGNILSAAFTHLGIGIRQGGTYQMYWVLLFGGP